MTSTPVDIPHYQQQCSTYSIFFSLLVGKIFYWVSMHFIFGDHVRILITYVFYQVVPCKEKFDTSHYWGLKGEI